jgi:hypothetical protein
MASVGRRRIAYRTGLLLVLIGLFALIDERLPAQGRDPVAEGAFRDYRGWKRVSPAPVLSESHNDTWVVTYLNSRAEGRALAGRFPFPEGAILVKESFGNVDQRPGPRGPVYVMEKRAHGYDAANGDWHWAVVEPDGKLGMSGSGRRDEETSLCAECHAKARVNDFVFGRGTAMKVTPVKP